MYPLRFIVRRPVTRWLSVCVTAGLLVSHGSIAESEALPAEPVIHEGDVPGADTQVIIQTVPRGPSKQDDYDRAVEALPHRGELARSAKVGNAPPAIDVPWGSAVGDTAGLPIAGSVSQLSDREWSMKVFNNSNDRYTADLALIQHSAGGKVLKTDYFSVPLGPKQNFQRKFLAQANTVDCSIELRSWKNLSLLERKEQRNAPPQRIVVQVTPTPTKPPVEQQSDDSGSYSESLVAPEPVEKPQEGGS